MSPVIRLQLILKRCFDLLAALGLLIILSPVMLVISVAILLTMGPPILFRQERLGHHGTPFTILKFRTMNEERDEEGNLLPNRERITVLGNFLRGATLDELPELFNVLKGEMSLVGPRPLLVDYRDLYSEEQWRRHDMPPGMAGPVLVSGRNLLTWKEKFERDVWYVDHWSLWLDLKILLQTAGRVISGEGVNASEHETMPRFTGLESEQEVDRSQTPREGEWWT